MLRLYRSPKEQRAGRACKRRSPQGPEDKKLQLQARGLQQEIVRQPPIRPVVHSYQRNQANRGESILPGLWGGGCSSYRRQVWITKGTHIQ
jgi:hypothetical protein